MSNEKSDVQDLSRWKEQHFWAGQPTKGRVIHIVYQDDRFEATGTLEDTGQVAFRVRGLVEVNLNRFKTQMWQEGARIVESRGPLVQNPVSDPPPGDKNGHGDDTSYSSRD